MKRRYAKALVCIYNEYRILMSVIVALDLGVKISRSSKEEVNVLCVEMLLLSCYRKLPIYLLDCFLGNIGISLYTELYFTNCCNSSFSLLVNFINVGCLVFYYPDIFLSFDPRMNTPLVHSYVGFFLVVKAICIELKQKCGMIIVCFFKFFFG